MEYKTVKGNLITLAQDGEFDVIAHGCNCWNMMGAGIASAMKQFFSCREFFLEKPHQKGDMNKLGQIDFETVNRRTGLIIRDWDSLEALNEGIVVVNAYTQYQGGANLDYEALALCLKKMNHEFKGKHIGLPMIGCGIAGGSWSIVSKLIQGHLYDCDVTIVEYDG